MLLSALMSGVERAPIYPFDSGEGSQRVREDSSTTFDLVLEHDEWAESQIGMRTDSVFTVDDAALSARSEQLERAKSTSHISSRGTNLLGILIGSTVKQMESEFNRKVVLDIGCGDGRFGAELARNAKARVTFLDNDATVLPSIQRRAGSRIVAEGSSLPFRDESFDKTMSAFSAVPWAETPLETVQSLDEALRVTRTGGTYFGIPVLANILGRHGLAEIETTMVNRGNVPTPYEDPVALKVWALQDHLIIHTLLNLVEEGYCAITWRSFIGKGMSTGAMIESYSAIVDKLKPIPAEVFAQNIDYAEGFMKKPEHTNN